MSSPLWLLSAVLVAHLLATLSPGPNVLLVMHTALAQSRRAGIHAALGVAAGAAVWCGFVLSGLSWLLARFEGLGSVLRIAGAAYLVVLGVRMFRAASADAFAGAATLPGSAAFRRGLLTNLTNPKALLFYASIFAALVVPELPLWVRVAAVAIVVVDSALWHVALACFFSTLQARQLYRRAKPAVDRCAGAALSAFGLWMALAW